MNKEDTKLSVREKIFFKLIFVVIGKLKVFEYSHEWTKIVKEINDLIEESEKR